MLVRDVLLERFLRRIYGAEPFLEYCYRNDIAFDQTGSGPMPAGSVDHWLVALEQLPRERRTQVEAELAAVQELADPEAGNHLLAAIEGQSMPADTIPEGPALALWFFLHHPAIFQAVQLHRETCEADDWYSVQTNPGIAIENLDSKAVLLGASLREFFAKHSGIGRFSTIESWRARGADCFSAKVSGRVRLVEGFTDEGEPVLQRVRPAISVQFAYSPRDGTILLQTALRANEKIRALFRSLAWLVLGVDLDESCLASPFALDCLKVPSPLLPDAEDMESVRIKTLHLRYPGRSGRRHLKLETLAGDEPAAIHQLLRMHLQAEGILETMEVSYAELHVRLKLANHRRKDCRIRLWPNRSNLGPTVLGERFRRCLRRWGIVRGEP